MGWTGSNGQGGFLRVVGLVAVTGIFSVFNPGVLIAVPFLLLVFFMPARGLWTALLAAAGILYVALGNPASGLWYVERGWALLLGGCFLSLSLRWPEGGFLPRGLAAVFGAFLAVGLFFKVRPGDWQVVEWAVSSRIEMATSSFLQAVRLNVGQNAVPAELEARALETMEIQTLIFPALLGLASLAALGLAWWGYLRVARAPGEGIGPLKEFRFNDQLVWILILGFVALLASSGVTQRIGTNAVVFMGALYALRGAAVVLFMAGGFSLLGGLLFLVMFIVIAPLVILGAVIVGLGDTWWDFRVRRPSTGPEA